jgi:proteasome lid subunit RPN8/RPN11
MDTSRTIGTIHDDAVAIAIREQVLDQILEYSAGEPLAEIGGFLIGAVRGSGQVVVVESFLPAEHTRSRAGSVTFTHETWATLTRQSAERFPGKRVVGWHHTHPGLGVFLSAYDLFIHRNFFREPWQIAMVVDPRAQELGFFHWRGGDVHDCGFLCLTESPSFTSESVSP